MKNLTVLVRNRYSACARTRNRTSGSAILRLSINHEIGRRGLGSTRILLCLMGKREMPWDKHIIELSRSGVDHDASLNERYRGVMEGHQPTSRDSVPVVVRYSTLLSGVALRVKGRRTNNGAVLLCAMGVPNYVSYGCVLTPRY